MPSATIRRKALLTIYFLCLTALLVFSGYRHRCKVLACEPASWADLYGIAKAEAAKSGSNYRIDDIRAEPDFGTGFTNTGPNDVRIRITLAPIQPEPLQYTPYPEYWIEFNDRDRWITQREMHATGSENPLLEAQQWLERVQVSPRDVYRTTWLAAQRELSGQIQHSPTSMSLFGRDFVQKRFGVESVWSITYSDEHEHITYWVDAQTGQVIAQEL